MKKLLASLLCAALYLGIMTPVSFAEELTASLCKSKIEAAAVLLEAEGEAAYDKIKDEAGEFRFAEGQGYIWIQSVDGMMIMHPIKPNLDGKGLMNMKDVDGLYLFVAFGEMAEENNSGWVPYKWPKPGQAETSQKVSYVKLVTLPSGDQVVIGCGLYDVSAADIAKDFPGDKIYKAE